LGRAVLAAWMRLKYPHISVGALASSAPILQFEDIVPPAIFYDLVSNDFKVCACIILASLCFYE
jgi:lysosomal Pro-X carboxypeptidase